MVTPDTNGGERRQRDPDSTRWSVVLAAGSEDSSVARSALAVLCETYWHSVYFFVRRRCETVVFRGRVRNIAPIGCRQT
jgi:hypothetical protein